MIGERFSGTAFLKGGGHSPCTLRLEPGALVIETGDWGGEWPYSGIRVGTAGNEDEYLLIQPDSGDDGPVEGVTLRDPAFNEALASRVSPETATFLTGFADLRRKSVGTKWRNLLLAGAAGILLLVGGYWVVTQWAAEWAARKMPVPLEVKWGNVASRAFLASKNPVEEGPAHDAAHILFRRLKEALPADNPYPLTLHVVEDPMVNAFALPGGHVVLMTGLMKDASGPEEVAGVLAHEIQHVLKRHVVKRIVQEMGWRAWFSMLFGGGDLSGVAFGAGSLMQLSFGRAQETEADVEGAKLLQAAGLPADPLADFFERLSTREGAAAKVPAFISTHPGSRERTRKLRELAATLKPVNPRPLDVDWEAVKKSLR